MSFFFNATATTEIYTYVHTLSLHDSLSIYQGRLFRSKVDGLRYQDHADHRAPEKDGSTCKAGSRSASGNVQGGSGAGVRAPLDLIRRPCAGRNTLSGITAEKAGFNLAGKDAPGRTLLTPRLGRPTIF